MPLDGAVFALDGILIGAGDTRFLMWGMLAAAARLRAARAARAAPGLGHRRASGRGSAALIAVRLVTLGVRFAGQRWALTGAPA